MRLSSRLIERYIVKAITPYLLLGLLLLTMILLIQQSGRFAEFLLSTYVPLSLLTDVAGALLPNVLTFTVPMATLAGTIIGFSRMSSDSELIAIRAAGVSNLHILKPALLIGLCLTAVTSLINLELAPAAARSLRRAGIQAALYKLESPVEPRTFNMEIPGYVVYVREGDKAQGVWERVFIYSPEKNGSVRLITARSGRIDSASEQSELVLSDAVATTIPGSASVQEGNKEGQYITERLAQLRIVLETGRKNLLERLQRDEPELDEMGLDMLSAQARTQTGKEQREASTLLHRRISMSLTPLVFALLGGSLALRFGRGGRGWGGLLSLLTLIAYYMISLMGEQMARKGTLPPSISVWLATAAAVGLSLFLLLPKRGGLFLRSGKRTGKSHVPASEYVLKQGLLQPARSRLLNFPSILDMGVIKSLFLNSAFSYITLVAIFLIFTLFELWRFIAEDSGAVWRVVRYLLFLLPLATVQLLPASLLIAVLVTYALMARRSEAIAWWAGGQSSYRLIIPGLVFALFIGGLTWLIQEKVMPQANLKQDTLRAQIRGGGISALPGSTQGRQWVPSATHAFGRLYSFKFDEEHGDLLEPAVYEFDAEGVHLSRIIEGKRGVWLLSGALEIEEAAETALRNSRIDYSRSPRLQLVGGGETPEMFKRQLNKPAHLSIEGLSEYIKIIKPTGRNINALQIALQKKYAEPHTAWVMTLFGIPLALSFGRRSAVTALCSSIAVGLAFWGISGVFQQLGEYGILSPPVAVWSPLSVFAALGVYLLTRMRT